MPDQKFARYHMRPFECGDGVRHEPGWYSWEDGQFRVTLTRHEHLTVDNHAVRMEFADLSECGRLKLRRRADFDQVGSSSAPRWSGSMPATLCGWHGRVAVERRG